LLKFGLIPELVGRLPVIAPLNALSKEDMIRILQEPKNALIRQYKTLLGYDKVKLEFTDDAREAIADKAIDMEIGARGLRSIMEKTMLQIMYEIPSEGDIDTVTISKDCIVNSSPPLTTKRKRPQIDPDAVSAS
jgi:ATP-dependent Clp protease ATP-binding subunit ClpX